MLRDLCRSPCQPPQENMQIEAAQETNPQLENRAAAGRSAQAHLRSMKPGNAFRDNAYGPLSSIRNRAASRSAWALFGREKNLEPASRSGTGPPCQQHLLGFPGTAAEVNGALCDTIRYFLTPGRRHHRQAAVPPGINCAHRKNHVVFGTLHCGAIYVSHIFHMIPVGAGCLAP